MRMVICHAAAVKTRRGRIKRLLQEFMAKVKAAFRTLTGGHEEARALLDNLGHYSREMQELWDAAMEESIGNVAASRQQDHDTEQVPVQYAVRTFADGRQYVEHDRYVITGNNPELWRDQVMNYINDEIRHGKDVTFYGADGEALTITEDTAGKARFRNMVTNPDGTQRLMYDDEYETKLRAETHIDELAQVSRGNGRTVPDDKNHPFAKDGFTYRTAYLRMQVATTG